MIIIQPNIWNKYEIENFPTIPKPVIQVTSSTEFTRKFLNTIVP